MYLKERKKERKGTKRISRIPSSCWLQWQQAASGSPECPSAGKQHRGHRWAPPAWPHPSEPGPLSPQKNSLGGLAWGCSCCNLQSSGGKQRENHQLEGNLVNWCEIQYKSEAKLNFCLAQWQLCSLHLSGWQCCALKPQCWSSSGCVYAEQPQKVSAGPANHCKNREELLLIPGVTNIIPNITL